LELWFYCLAQQCFGCIHSHVTPVATLLVAG
jgi:hypothetical protein